MDMVKKITPTFSSVLYFFWQKIYISLHIWNIYYSKVTFSFFNLSLFVWIMCKRNKKSGLADKKDSGYIC